MAGIGAGVRPPSAPTHVRGDSSVRVPPACTGERGEEGGWTGATQRRGHDGQVKQGEQEGLHARDSVGPTSGATPRGLNPGFSEKIGNSRRTGCQGVAEADQRARQGGARSAPRACSNARADQAEGVGSAYSSRSITSTAPGVIWRRRHRALRRPPPAYAWQLLASRCS